MKIIENGVKLIVSSDKHKVFEHSPQKPFISALFSENEFRFSHGSFKVKSKAVKKLPLTDYVRTETPTGCKITFSGAETSVTVTLSERNGGLELKFSPNGKFGVELTFAAVGEEGIFGGGEQFKKLNMKGEKIINLVSEHISVPPIAEKILFKKLYREKPHSYIKTYAPMTTYVSSALYALRFDVSAYGVADFTYNDVSVFRFSECPRSTLFVSGADFAQIGKILNENIPCRESLPDWCYDGMIVGVQGGFERVLEKAWEMKEKGVKTCAVWCQDWSGKKVTAAGKQVYWNWSADENLYPNFAENVRKLKEDGIRFLAYINPYLVKDGKLYDFCKNKGYLIKRADGQIYHVKSTTFDAGMLDLTNPDAVSYIKETLIKKNMLDLGIDGYMADFGEHLPVDCVLSNGDPALLHNEWPTLWAKINREAVDTHPRAKEIMFFTRSAYNGAQAQTFIMWNGDQHTDFSKDYGMGCVMPAAFNLGFSGMTAVHSDIGGFISFASLKRDRELTVRWMEMCAFSPLMRSHETIRPEVNAQPYDSEIIGYAAKLSYIHSQLKPYIKQCMEKAQTGIPVMRPDFYDSGDFSKHKDLYSYLFGDEIYVCPIIERGATDRKVYLPDGDWVRFFGFEEYAGGGTYTVSAPLGEPIAFFRKGGQNEALFRSVRIN